jgi:hypothetical protein
VVQQINLAASEALEALPQHCLRRRTCYLTSYPAARSSPARETLPGIRSTTRSVRGSTITMSSSRLLMTVNQRG